MAAALSLCAGRISYVVSGFFCADVRAHSTEQEIRSEQTLRRRHGKIFNWDGKRDGDNETNESHQEVRTRKYDDADVALSLTVRTVGLVRFKSFKKAILCYKSIYISFFFVSINVNKDTVLCRLASGASPLAVIQ